MAATNGASTNSRKSRSAGLMNRYPARPCRCAMCDRTTARGPGPPRVLRGVVSTVVTGSHQRLELLLRLTQGGRRGRVAGEDLLPRVLDGLLDLGTLVGGRHRSGVRQGVVQQRRPGR